MVWVMFGRYITRVAAACARTGRDTVAFELAFDDATRGERSTGGTRRTLIATRSSWRGARGAAPEIVIATRLFAGAR
jgi:hypothetical protein